CNSCELCITFKLAGSTNRQAKRSRKVSPSTVESDEPKSHRLLPLSRLTGHVHCLSERLRFYRSMSADGVAAELACVNATARISGTLGNIRISIEDANSEKPMKTNPA